MNLLEKITKIGKGANILRDWLGSGSVCVDQAHAQRRADVCIDCRMNQEGHQLTEAVAMAIKDNIELKNGLGLRVNGEKSLHTCSACLCAIRLKIWCPTELLARRIEPEEIDKFASDCWIRAELNQKNATEPTHRNSV